MKKWMYSLTPQEEALAARVGWERQLPMLGQPERNRNYSEGDIWEAWQHMVCAASEIAAARMLGMEDFEPHVNTFKSKLDIPGYEVRYSFTNGNGKHHLRFNSKVDDPNQVYILIVGGPESKTRRSADNGYRTPPFRAVGWMRGENCVIPAFKTARDNNSFSVPVAQLMDMAELPVREEVV